MADAASLCVVIFLVKIYAVPIGNCDRHRVARKLLESIYENLKGNAMPNICKDGNGKPYFSDNSLYFSLSYTANFCFCAVSDFPVGVDAEMCREVKQALFQGVLSPNERRFIEESSDKQHTFMRFWTLKEAYVKYTGQGIANTRLRETEFDVSGDTPVLMGQEELYFYCRTVDLEGHRVVISVCTADKCCPQLYLEGEEYAQF